MKTSIPVNKEKKSSQIKQVGIKTSESNKGNAGDLIARKYRGIWVINHKLQLRVMQTENLLSGNSSNYVILNYETMGKSRIKDVNTILSISEAENFGVWLRSLRNHLCNNSTNSITELLFKTQKGMECLAYKLFGQDYIKLHLNPNSENTQVWLTWQDVNELLVALPSLLSSTDEASKTKISGNHQSILKQRKLRATSNKK